ncbi:MAG: hypothetical protein NTW25_00175, partial [Candidatus Kapabacteria bacterium]|nr:hypothetical protein [Candidatus Kapabacteria bacterium]
MQRFIFAFVFIYLTACTKTSLSPTPPTLPFVQEEAIKFSVTPDISSGILNLSSDTLNLNISLSSKLPALGLLYSLEVKRNDTLLTTYKLDTSSTQSTISIKVSGFTIRANYTAKITVTSKSTSTNSLVQTFVINRSRIYKNYLMTSYELSNFDAWFSSAQLYKSDGSKYQNNPFIDEQSTQVDIDGDGQEDVFFYESYDLNISPTPNPPPSIFMNNGTILKQIPWTGANINEPH